nr:MAG TPA: hypothetical protein [Caudoviricetes sp.]
MPRNRRQNKTPGSLRTGGFTVRVPQNMLH